MFKLPDGSLRLIVQGLGRVTLEAVTSSRPYPAARASRRCSEALQDAHRLEVDALMRNIKASFQQVVSLSPLLSEDLQTLAASTSPSRAVLPTSSRRVSTTIRRPR